MRSTSHACANASPIRLCPCLADVTSLPSSCLGRALWPKSTISLTATARAAPLPLLLAQAASSVLSILCNPTPSHGFQTPATCFTGGLFDPCLSPSATASSVALAQFLLLYAVGILLEALSSFLQAPHHTLLSPSSGGATPLCLSDRQSSGSHICPRHFPLILQ